MNTYANRGMDFESLVTYASEQYEAKGIANIKKVSTPWVVIRKGPKIVNAFPKGKSTVDFMGDYNGQSICFEAKSTKNGTSFPLSNFEEHQIEFIRSWQGLSFALIHFETHNETYLIIKEHLLQWWDDQLTGGRKSIPISWIRESCKRVVTTDIALDYLKAI